jgi:16S rRNA (guanine(527)-N(7))-methyltransferase RsmG
VGVELPELSGAEFERRLTGASPRHDLGVEIASKLHAHYEELRRWNRTLSLVGPAFVGEGITRHYAESLAGLELISSDDRLLLDIGSGAGFPGLILAAARPDLDATLIEARERKSAFLAAAARRMALQVRCLNVRLGSPPPPGLPVPIDVVTVRAVRIDSTFLAPILPLLAREGRILLWATEPPSATADLMLVGDCRLSGGRRILSYRARR